MRASPTHGKRAKPKARPEGLNMHANPRVLTLALLLAIDAEIARVTLQPFTPAASRYVEALDHKREELRDLLVLLSAPRLAA